MAKEPTVTLGKETLVLNEQSYQVLSELISRAQLMARLGQQYGNDRDIYEALGYPLTVEYASFAAKYERQDIAHAVIKRPVDATWRGGITIEEPNQEKETELETAWKTLDEQLKIVSKFKRIDKLSSLGRYGVLLLGLNDVSVPAKFKEPVSTSGERKLLYVKPFGEGAATIHTWVRNTSDPRYGLPDIYKLTLAQPGTDGSKTTDIEVHHTRIIHITLELMQSEVHGTPQLRAIYNRLLDLEKLVGGSAEMFWRGARPGYQGKVDENFQLTDDMRTDLQSQIDEYEHNLRRILMNEGVTFEGLETQVSDPKGHVDIQIQMISAVTGIPKRILTGSERGELASSEDRDSWLELVQDRREDHGENDIVRPFIDRCIEFGILPKPKDEDVGYSVIWSDLWAKSEKDLAEIGKTRSEALEAYSKDPISQFIVPPEIFYKYFLGLTDDQITALEEAKKNEMLEEEEDFEDVDE